MALPALAGTEDLTDRSTHPIATGDDAIRAWAALNDASAAVRAVAHQTWVDAGGELVEVPELVVSIVCAAARRALDNPGGYVSESEAIGTYSRSYRRADGDHGAGVYLTDGERRALLALRPGGGLRTLRVTREGVYTRGVPIANGEPL